MAWSTQALGENLLMSFALNVSVDKPPSKYLCLYPHICDALNLSWRSFLLQQVTVNRETLNY